ncbi:16S rRNA (guanine(966)-N(2))-methyltransferase [Candidatus Rhodobacter oscarellae]|uniref:16S rRNA (Guanine(966)-N(2))-methyltransferase n=1 Tax=Candidatus Rhodobacter oscarellae TaxID=1675527 RepID=A0A0J9ED78_9RHOB|nr:16S rRNA (guanine(966)-N(2))-methyltransferase RsmD [Candidatus Rhodobacter lobularis]KMW60616.1 16S rRNA (guanine(966)-N(2))-methyltransferase [Candidatus Rhodobacter lobularis]
MRIIAGQHRGLRLASVGKGDAGAHLRPTSDRVREALFNVLANRVDLDGARVLDLFAGTGALGFEALSRGASHVTFVDDGSAARALLRENTALTKSGGAVKVYRRDATRLGDCQSAPFDLVFLDPPYGKGLGERALQAAQDGGWLAPRALVVWEESAEMPPPEGFAPQDARRYGDTHITILEAP